MEKRLYISFAFLSLVVAGGFVYGHFTKTPTPEPKPPQTAIEQVRNAVQEFGSRLKLVTLTAPPTEFRRAMREHYAGLVSEEILKEWEAHPEKAIGRLSSSPWPDRIEIVLIEREEDGAYSVQGKVIEITSKEVANGGIANDYPVALKLRNQSGKWVITGIAKGVYRQQ